MTTSAKKAPIRNGLRDISMDEFWKDPLVVVEAIHEKLQAIPIDAKNSPRFAAQMRTAQELLRALGTRRYGRVSCLAAVDLLQAAHYFLVLGDRTPDSRQGGYKDDAEVLNRVFTKHAAEIHDFEAWLKAQS